MTLKEELAVRFQDHKAKYIETGLGENRVQEIVFDSPEPTDSRLVFTQIRNTLTAAGSFGMAIYVTSDDQSIEFWGDPDLGYYKEHLRCVERTGGVGNIVEVHYIGLKMALKQLAEPEAPPCPRNFAVMALELGQDIHQLVEYMQSCNERDDFIRAILEGDINPQFHDTVEELLADFSYPVTENFTVEEALHTIRRKNIEDFARAFGGDHIYAAACRVDYAMFAKPTIEFRDDLPEETKQRLLHIYRENLEQSD